MINITQDPIPWLESDSWGEKNRMGEMTGPMAVEPVLNGEINEAIHREIATHDIFLASTGWLTATDTLELLARRRVSTAIIAQSKPYIWDNSDMCRTLRRLALELTPLRVPIESASPIRQISRITSSVPTISVFDSGDSSDAKLPMMHHKFCLFGRFSPMGMAKFGTAIITSANLTHGSCRNRESGVLLRDINPEAGGHHRLMNRLLGEWMRCLFMAVPILPQGSQENKNRYIKLSAAHGGSNGNARA